MKPPRRFLLAISMLLCLSACGPKNPRASAASAEPPAMPVKVQKAEARPIPEFTEYIATLKSRDSSVLNPEVEGQIVRIFVHSGDHVEAGTPILEIDPRRQEATVRSQEASHASRQATMEYNRIELDRRRKLF